VQRGASESYGIPGTMVHNAMEYPFSSPDISSDSYIRQPPAQYFAHNLIPIHGQNGNDNQPGHSRSVIKHSPLSLSTGTWLHNNPHDYIMWTSHPTHTLQSSSIISPMPPNGSSARDAASLPAISAFRYHARLAREVALQLVTEDPASFGSDHPNVSPQLQQQCSQRNSSTSSGHYDAHPSSQPSGSWDGAAHVRSSSNAAFPEGCYSESFLFQQRSWQSDTTISWMGFPRKQVSLPMPRLLQ